MALAVASTSTATTTTATTVVVTKPTGVASGDLLVILASTHLDSTQPPTCSGFASKISAGAGTGLNPKVVSAILWRIADASDVSATNYTVNGVIATMIRITGWTSGDPFFFTNSFTAGNSSSSVNVGNTVSADRPTPSLMLILSGLGSRLNDSNPTWASFSVTSGESNPTWTEVQDAEFRYNGSDWGGQSVAYASTSNTSDVTAWNTTITKSTDAAQIAGLFAIICEPQNVTADVSHLAVTPTVESVTASQVNVTADVGHNAITPTLNGIESEVSSDGTQWTNESKNTSTWTNELKS